MIVSRETFAKEQYRVYNNNGTTLLTLTWSGQECSSHISLTVCVPFI